MAVGLVPPMLFLVDFVSRGIGAGANEASIVWIVYGIGSMCGPPAYGWLTDRLGATSAIRWTLGLQAAALWAFVEYTACSRLPRSHSSSGVFRPESCRSS